MSKRDIIFNQVIAHFLETEQLGDYDESSFSLTLYAVPDKPHSINEIKKYMNSVTSKHKVIVLPAYGGVSNVKILDIGI